MTQVMALLKEASKLDLPERAELVSSLLEDLDPEPHHVSDEEAIRRLGELKSGKVEGLSREDFWKACGRS
jgi:putative addiction module component (TIGR02574 family)